MTSAISTRGASALWISLLTGASTATTLVLACATPFPALAALAAVHMRARDGIALMLMTWAASQAVGFFILGYPRDASTIAWGFGLGGAAVASAVGGYAALRGLAGWPATVRLAAAFAAGFVAYNATIMLCATMLGGLHIAMSFDLLAQQFLLNAVILVGLYALYRCLVAAGLPAPPRPGLA